MIDRLLPIISDAWHDGSVRIGTTIGATIQGLITFGDATASGSLSGKQVTLSLVSLLLAPVAAGLGAWLSKRYFGTAKQEAKQEASDDAITLALKQIADLRHDLSTSDNRADAKDEAYRAAMERIRQLEKMIPKKEEKSNEENQE